MKDRIQEREEAIKGEDHLFYGLGHNSIRIRMSETMMKAELDWRVWREFAINSTPLVVDFSYLSQINNLAKKRSLIQSEGRLALHYTTDKSQSRLKPSLD